MKVLTLCIILGFILLTFAEEDFEKKIDEKALQKKAMQKLKAAMNRKPTGPPRKFDRSKPTPTFDGPIDTIKKERSDRRRAIKQRDRIIRRQAMKREKKKKQIQREKELLKKQQEEELQRKAHEEELIKRLRAEIMQEISNGPKNMLNDNPSSDMPTTEPLNMPCNMQCPACNSSMPLPCVEYSKVTCHWPF